MSNDPKREHIIELLGAAAAAAGPQPAPAQAKNGEEEEALRLVAQLGLSLAPHGSGVIPPQPAASHGLAFKLHVSANVVAVTLDLLLVIYVILIFLRRVKPPVAGAAKRLMWVALAATYFTFAIGVFLELQG